MKLKLRGLQMEFFRNFGIENVIFDSFIEKTLVPHSLLVGYIYVLGM